MTSCLYYRYGVIHIVLEDSEIIIIIDSNETNYSISQQQYVPQQCISNFRPEVYCHVHLFGDN